MLDIFIIDYGELGIRYTVVDKDKIGKEFIVKEFKSHKDALDYIININNKKEDKYGTRPNII